MNKLWILLFSLPFVACLPAMDSDTLLLEHGRVKAILLNIDTDNPLFRIENNSSATFCVRYPVAISCELHKADKSEYLFPTSKFAATSGPWKRPQDDLLIKPGVHVELQLAEPLVKSGVPDEWVGVRWDLFSEGLDVGRYRLDCFLSGIDRIYTNGELKFRFVVPAFEKSPPIAPAAAVAPNPPESK